MESFCKRDSHMTYWVNDNLQYHRENGPAVIHSDGTQEWWQNGKLHREDGPAIGLHPQKCFNYWYIDHVEYSEKNYQIYMLLKKQGLKKSIIRLLVKDIRSEHGSTFL